MKLSLSSVLVCLVSINGARGASSAASNGSETADGSWSTLTPSNTLSGATSSFDGSFALSIKTLSAASAAASPSANAKRDGVAQISDGQIQANSATTLSTVARPTASVLDQISDGQVQQQTADVVNQISDGQVQQQTADVVNQISDGQVQQQTADVVNQISDGQIQQQTAADVVTQISDGQVQQPTAAADVSQISDGQVQQPTTAAAVSQISDGQVQDQTATTAAGVSQISDGQIQQTTAAGVSQISDGQAQATGSPSSGSDSGISETCASPGSLTLTLKDGILKDGHGRIGAIVANHQFQFDGPPPQAGSIYAAGWSVSDGKLALGDKTKFFKCLSGTFYNLYDESIGGQCAEVEIDILKIVDC